MLKAMGSERSFQKVKVYFFKDQIPWRTYGVELFFKNEKSLFLGKAKAGDTCTLSLARRVASITVEKTSHDSERIERKLQTFDASGGNLGCFWFRNPLFSD